MHRIYKIIKKIKIIHPDGLTGDIDPKPLFFAVQKNLVHCTKMNFSIKGLFSKYDEIRRKLRIWSNLVRKSLMENFIFCEVVNSTIIRHFPPKIKHRRKGFDSKTHLKTSFYIISHLRLNLRIFHIHSSSNKFPNRIQ